RPVSPGNSIQARPVSSGNSITARPVQPIRARPVSNTNGTVSASTNALRTGLQYLGNKQYNEAIQQFKQLGSTYEAHYNLGRAYRQYGQAVRETNKKQFSENMTQAAERFEEAVRIKPDALDAYFQLGMCYRDLALPQHATNAFKKALSLAPDD